MKKRGFTIVELVIVIAVIAILAAVLVPTFSNVIKKAQISSDVTLCRNMNTVLADAEAEGRIPGSVYDVLYLENEAGFVIANLNAKSDGFYYAWDEKENRMIYLSDLNTVYFPEDYTLDPSICWITAKTVSEAEAIGGAGFNIALANDIEEPITLANVVSIDTLGFKCTNVTMKDGEHNVQAAKLVGTFGETNVTSTMTSIETSGCVTSLNVKGGASVTVGGVVTNLNAQGSSTVVSSTGMVNTVVSSSGITNNGVVLDSTANVVEGKLANSNAANGNIVKATSKSDLDSIRAQVASGKRTFEGESVKLGGDINLNGIAMTPIANVSRDGVNASSTGVFKGTFDGQGYTIQNYSTSGFSIAGLNAGTNSSSVSFGDSGLVYNEAIYGLLGVTYDAVIRDVTITVDIDLVIDNGNHYVGDSVGGIVGCAFGTITFENCTVSGTINGYDGVGGLLGRMKGTSATFINCTNNANVTGVRKTGGFIGSTYANSNVASASVTYIDCVNNGNITCLGREKDIELEAKGNLGADLISGYYTASASNGEYGSADADSNNAKVTVTANKKAVGFANNGLIKVGSVAAGDGTYWDFTAKAYKH